MNTTSSLLIIASGQTKTEDLGFYCFGCEEIHYVRTRGFFKRNCLAQYDHETKEKFKAEHYSEFTFNNNFNIPTIKEPIHTTGEHGRCDCLISKGRIIYLGTTEHQYAGRSFNMKGL